MNGKYKSDYLNCENKASCGWVVQWLSLSLTDTQFQFQAVWSFSPFLCGVPLEYYRFVSHFKQAAVSHELKRWCMSQVNDMNIHIPTKAQYYKLLPSPSVEQTVANPDLESLPLLSVVSGDSSSSLATYVNILPSEPIHSLEGQDEERLGSRTYFEMRVNKSPGTSKNFYQDIL